MGKSASNQPNLPAVADASAVRSDNLAEPAPFSPIEALRNLVLFHDGDVAFMAANRGLIADMPFGETSFQESLWQVARDIVASNPLQSEESK
jgi:hypothetical protein